MREFRLGKLGQPRRARAQESIVPAPGPGPGDTVNTAKRIEGAAQGGEVLVSAEAISDIAHAPRLGAPRRVTVKGKEKEIEVFPLLD